MWACKLLLFSHIICNSSHPIIICASSASKDPGIAPLPVVYLVQLEDFGPHYSHEIGRKHVHSIHTTKSAPSKKVIVLNRVIRRDEDYNNMAQLEIEHEDGLGYYFGDLELNQDMTDDGIDHTEVSVVKMHIRGEYESPYSDDEVEDEVEDDDYHPREKTADDLAKERARERFEQGMLNRERECISKRRRL
jgi:hypothetical protein